MPASRFGLHFEPLEERTVLSVTLAPIVGHDANNAFNIPSGKNLYVPLTGSSPGQTISYTVSSSNSAFTTSVLNNNPTLVLNVSGTKADNSTFTGTLTIELFQDLAPNTVSTIMNLVNSGFYTNLSFYRIVPDFVIQGGANGTKTAPTFNDEFNIGATFNSPGLLAMANPGTANSNTSEFFITDIDLPLTGDVSQPQYLNYRHSIFGQLTSGFDVYQNIMNAKGITSTNSTPSPAVVITSASILSNDTQNGVLRISEPTNFTGAATITVTATASDNSTATQTFTINAAPPTAASQNQPLFLAPVTNQTTTQNNAISFQISATRLQAGTQNALSFSVTATDGFRGTPQNVTVQVTPNANGTSATVTLTPTSGFLGTINLLAHVDDNTNAVHDALPFTLQVNPAVTPNAGSGSLQGVVFVDLDGDTLADTTDTNLAGVILRLTGTDSQNNVIPAQTTITATNGTYVFNNIPVGTYTITEVQPGLIVDGGTKAGGLGGTATTNAITNIPVTANANGANYNFYEKTMVSSAIDINLFLASTPPVQQVYANLIAKSTPSLPIIASMAKTSTDPTNAATVTYTVTFNKSVTGVDASDFAITASPGLTSSVASVTGSGTVYTVTVNTTTGAGTGTIALRLVDNDSIIDASSTPLGGAGNNANFIGPSYTVNRTASVAVSTITPATINASNQTNTSASGTGDAGATVSVVASDGTHTTAAATGTVNSSGNWTVTGINVSTLNNGTITYTVTETTTAGLTATNSKTTTKDTVAPTVSLVSVTNPVNSGNVASTTASGTGEAGASISVVASDGTHTSSAKTTTVSAGGTWTTADIDVSSLNQGTITYTVTATDAAGNTATSTKTTTKDTVAPSIVVSTVPASVSSTNAANTTATGTTEIGATVTVVATDGTHTTTAVNAVVAGNGTWTASGINVTGLNDGTITYTATATDTNGNTATNSKTTTKDAQGPALAISTQTGPVNASNVANASINGTGENGSSIKVTVTDGTHTTTEKTTTVAGGTWSITALDLSGLDDGDITYTVTATLASDPNPTVATKTVTKDVIAPQVTLDEFSNPINNGNKTGIAASGTGENLSTVRLVVSNGSQHTDGDVTVIGQAGTWELDDIDVSALADGTITYTLTATDPAGNTTVVTKTANKDTVPPTVAINTISSPLNAQNATNTSASGTVEVGSTVSVKASNGATTSIAVNGVVQGDGSWTATGIDISGLADGTITYTVTATDAAGNTATSTKTGSKDTVAPAVAVTTVTTPVNSGNETTTSASGTVEAGATVTVVASDGTHSTSPATAVVTGGTWTVSNINVSGLNEGTVTYTATATDTFGNHGTGSKTTTIDTVAPELTFAFFDDPINLANVNNISAGGSVEVGSTVTLTVTDGTHNLGPFNALITNGTWFVANVDASSLTDGTITFTAHATDAAGNTSTETETATKDTVAPNLTLTTVTNPITSDNATATSASGLGDVDFSVAVSASDGTKTTTTLNVVVNGDNEWSVNNLDVSALADGTITYTAKSTDAAGNTTTKTLTSTKSTVDHTSQPDGEALADLALVGEDDWTF